MKYTNPIIQADYSDPDVIRYNEDFYMVASSFNHTPGVPILHSINLVDWEIINYVFDNINIKRFDNVCHGDGAWAPAIRYNNGLFYVMIPFPDEGIYVSYAKNPYDKWSEPHLLIKGRGLEDPCPIWDNDKCYVVVGFAKSRAGFNSCIALYEASIDLKEILSDGYKIIYDGHDNNPTIEGPKFNVRNGYYYIMAPAGSVKGGWQTALRSKNIYGPYESKVVLMQGDTLINGPHQGALIDIDDNDNWAFIHFQDMRAYGRVCHLEPVTWYNDWPIPGHVGDPLLAGTPVSEHEYLINKKSDYFINTSDDFSSNKLSLIWQTPANKKDNWYELKEGLVLNCLNGDIKNLHMLPNHFMQKVMYLEFEASSKANFNLIDDGDEIGFSIMGTNYAYICVRRENAKNYIEINEGSFNSNDKVIYKEEYNSNEIIFNLDAYNTNIYDLNYKLGFNGKYLYENKATAGRWIGAKLGIYAKGYNKGYAVFKYYNQEKK
ncbi:MAG: family 43 glycosylhydrolase [Anaeroplasmataceae bacterium]